MHALAAKHTPPVLPVPADDAEAAAIFALPAAERERVASLHSAFGALPARPDDRRRALARLAAGDLAPLGLSATRLRILFGQWRRDGWAALARRYKGGTARVNTTFMQWFAALHERCQRERTGATAWSLFRRQYERWLGGDATAAIPGLGAMPPPPHGRERVPAGHGYRNLMRHLSHFSPMDATLAKRGRHKAREALPPVLHTRAALLPGQMYFVDDSWHNSYVIHPESLQAVRVLELVYLDVATTRRTLFGLMPRLTAEDGKSLAFVAKDMLCLTVAHLRQNGWHPDGCVIPMEGGTACLSEAVVERILHVTSGKVRFVRMGADRVSAFLGDYAGAAKSNPRRKALLEGSFAFTQRRLSWVPGQTGGNARLDKPEGLDARLTQERQLLSIERRLDADLAADLPHHFPTLEQYHALVDETYAEIDGRTEHNIEGWVQHNWLAPALPGMSHTAFAALPAPAQQAFLASLAQSGQPIPMRRLSPAEVWRQHAPGLRHLPLRAVPFLLGPEFSRKRTVSQEHIFTAGGRKYLAQLPTQDGTHHYMLHPGQSYMTCLNPFEPQFLHVLDGRGEWLGVCPAWERADYADPAASVGAMATQNAILGEARSRVSFRAQDAMAQRLHAAESVNARALTQLKRLLPADEVARRQHTAPKPPAATTDATDADVEDMLSQTAPESVPTQDTPADGDDDALPWQ
ncbi:MAG: hypothetical protein LBC18_03145 [Opitutaceae bacterium]|jgi:hypothetical protein|nr:hypothetical protein [Opitutaceae bacterium]